MSMADHVVRGTNLGNGIRCHELFYPAGFHIPTHAHDDPFFTLTLQGAFRDGIHDVSIEYPAHSILYQAAGREHSFTAGRDVRCFVLELNSDEIEQRYSLRFPQSVERNSEGALARLMIATYRELKHRDAMSTLAIEGLVLQLLVESQRAGIERGRPLWLHHVEDLLQERFREPLTLAAIAAEVGVDASQLSSAFRRVHGRTLADKAPAREIDSQPALLVGQRATMHAPECGRQIGRASCRERV